MVHVRVRRAIVCAGRRGVGVGVRGAGVGAALVCCVCGKACVCVCGKPSVVWGRGEAANGCGETRQLKQAERVVRTGGTRAVWCVGAGQTGVGVCAVQTGCGAGAMGVGGWPEVCAALCGLTGGAETQQAHGASGNKDSDTRVWVDGR